MIPIYFTREIRPLAYDLASLLLAVHFRGRSLRSLYVSAQDPATEICEADGGSVPYTPSRADHERGLAVDPEKLAEVSDGSSCTLVIEFLSVRG